MSHESTGSSPASDGAGPSEGLDALTEEVLPALIARLRASRLAELEVRRGDWRIRLRRDPRGMRGRRGPGGGDSGPGEAGQPGDDLGAAIARSPAVGYFNPAPDLAVGRSVQAGDSLGVVDVLGIVQDVAAPSDGIVSGVLAEGGQAVEYGQVLAEVDSLGADVTADLDGTSVND